MNVLEANVFIRYLIGDDATKQQKSKDLIGCIRIGQEEAFTTDVISFSTSAAICVGI